VSAGTTGGWPFGANTATNGLDPISVGPSGDKVGVGLPSGTSPVSTLEVRVTDTLAGSQLEAFAISHRTSGTPAANFSIQQGFYLDNASRTLTRSGIIRSAWVTPTAGSETSSLDILTMDAGAMQVAAKFRGAGYVELPTQNAGLTAMLLSSGGDQEIQKTGGNFGFGSGQARDLYFFSSGTVQMKVKNQGDTVCDIVLGTFANLANNATHGFVFIPVSGTTGTPTGAPIFTGASAAHAAMFFNIIDNKLWIHNQTAWKSVTLA